MLTNAISHEVVSADSAGPTSCSSANTALRIVLWSAQRLPPTQFGLPATDARANESNGKHVLSIIVWALLLIQCRLKHWLKTEWCKKNELYTHSDVTKLQRTVKDNTISDTSHSVDVKHLHRWNATECTFTMIWQIMDRQRTVCTLLASPAVFKLFAVFQDIEE